VDEDVIEKLYAASKAGVKIRMIIRGICSLVPGIAGSAKTLKPLVL
jgi:polyphosphate kinase